MSLGIRREKHPPKHNCPICDDLKRVSRIIGGKTWTQDCPGCAGGSW